MQASLGDDAAPAPAPAPAAAANGGDAANDAMSITNGHVEAANGAGDGRNGASAAGPGGNPVQNPFKIYIGGLPSSTRYEDLDDCFSALGKVKSIELKKGYGFVEYEEPQAASDAVSKYHEGHFLGAEIRVELSTNTSRRHTGGPDTCYACGCNGHWARDCPKGAVRRPPLGALRARSMSPRRDDRWARPYSRDAPPLRNAYSRPPPRDDTHVRARDTYERPAPRDDPYSRRDPGSRYAAPPLDRERDRYDDRRAGERDRYRDVPPRDAREPYGAPPPPPARDYYDAPSYGPPPPRDDPYARSIPAPLPPASDPYTYPPRDPYYSAPPPSMPPPSASRYSAVPGDLAESPRAPDRDARDLRDGRDRGYPLAPPPAAASYSSRHDDRGMPPPLADDRRRYPDRDRHRAPLRDDRREPYPPRERSPPRRAFTSRRSPSPARSSGSRYNAPIPPAAAGYGAPPPTAGYVRGPPSGDDYRRGPPPSSYREPYTARR